MPTRLRLKKREPESGEDVVVAEYGDDDYGHFEGDLWDWLEANVPKPSQFQLCEKDDYHRDCGPDGERADAFATTFEYAYDGEHICYTYICDECCENMADGYEGPIAEDVPTDMEGYVVDPTHCVS